MVLVLREEGDDNMVTAMSLQGAQHQEEEEQQQQQGNNEGEQVHQEKESILNNFEYLLFNRICGFHVCRNCGCCCVSMVYILEILIRRF